MLFNQIIVKTKLLTAEKRKQWTVEPSEKIIQMLKYLRENYDLRDLNCENMKMQMGIQKWNQKKRKTGTIDFNFFFTQSNGVSHFHRVSTCDCDLINYCQIIEQSNADKRWTHEINYQINSIFLDGCLLIKTEYIACATYFKHGERVCVCVCVMCVYVYKGI